MATRRPFVLISGRYKELPSGDVLYGTRRRLTADTTLYVRTDGSDSNDGSADNAGGAFLTIQKAANVAFGEIDLGPYNLTIQVRSGTYTGAVTVTAPKVGSGSITFVGDNTTPANVLVDTTLSCFAAQGPVNFNISGFKLQSSAGACIAAQYGATVNITNLMDFGFAAVAHLLAQFNGNIYITSNYTISDDSFAHVWVDNSASVFVDSKTVTLTGTPAWTLAFAFANLGGTFQATSMTYTGAATGARYLAEYGGGIFTNGGGASYFPGNSAGSVIGTGFYDGVSGFLTVSSLMDLVDPVAASVSSNEITLNCNNGNNLYFTRTLAAHEKLLPPTNMDLGATCTLQVVPTATTPAPAVRGTSKNASAASDSTSHAITLPSNIALGDLILVIFAVDGNPTVSINTGASGNNWNILGQASNSTIATCCIVWKWAEGSDALTLTTSASEQSSHICLRIAGALATGDVSGTSANANGSNPDLALHTPAGGSKNYLWIAAYAHDAQVVVTAAPSGYGNLDSQAAAGANGASASMAYKTASAASDNPGTATATSEQWAGFTIAVGPTADYFQVTFDTQFQKPVPSITKESTVQIQKIGASKYTVTKNWGATS